MNRFRNMLCMLSCLAAGAAHGFTPEPVLDDPAQERVAQAVFHALRCVVCDGQSLAESDATLATQMRSEIRRMAKDGQNATEISQFFQERYGDVILMSPPLQPTTYLLWAAPLLFLLIGIALLRRKI